MKIKIEVTISKETQGDTPYTPETMELASCEEDEGCFCLQLGDETYHIVVKEIMEALALLC